MCACQCADEKLQWLPLFLLGTDTKDAPSIGQDGHTRANQPSQRVGVDDVILHGGYLIHHVGAGGGQKELLARAGTHEEKEEVVMGRKGCRELGKAGILSGRVWTLHGLSTAGKEHGSGATQWNLRGRGWPSLPSSLVSRKGAGDKERKKKETEEK